MIRRINFFAGPGSGKSTIAARTFSELKMRGHDVEHVSEFVKTMAHEGRFPTSFDQVHIFGEQIHREDIALRHVKAIVTDSPILMQCVYGLFYKATGVDALFDVASSFDESFPAINFYLNRTVDYVDKGRYQNLDQALEFDEFLKVQMKKHLGNNWKSVNIDQFDEIIAEIESAIT